MYVLDNRIKWFVKKDYLEIYDAKNDKFFKADAEGIDLLWISILGNKKEVSNKESNDFIDLLIEKEIISEG